MIDKTIAINCNASTFTTTAESILRGDVINIIRPNIKYNIICI